MAIAMITDKRTKIEILKKVATGQDPIPGQVYVLFDKKEKKKLSLRACDTVLLFVLGGDSAPIQDDIPQGNTLYHPKEDSADTDDLLQEETALQDIASDSSEIPQPPQGIKEAIQADPQEEEAIPAKPASITFNLMGELVETMERDKQRAKKMDAFKRGYQQLNFGL